ncbi:deoxyribodipyrimidine photo-lyase [Ruficoccus sp. ZRK36]|uniref:cryptochrome/photolyase family protein n=1 Tax=Ruficoccus sp. ZRK36 TaxID=2866311 RepID=UPI001C72AD83|nr:deoxyribodipyrimidine photo-lyase [Ruficoccus sp. ZRK36]QYY37225.1 DNA photolyase family protein [Ruficoccus sp. ZRK36]
MSTPDNSMCLLWFRQDLRVEDNPALSVAAETGQPILPVYIYDEKSDGDWAPGGASRWWLHHALADLAEQLKELGLPLIIRRGETLECLRDLIRETEASVLCANRRYEPEARRLQDAVEKALSGEGVEVSLSNAALLFEPWEIEKKSGGPFQVFTPYWRTCREQAWPVPVEADSHGLHGPEEPTESLALDDLKLLPRIGWDAGFYEAWTPTRAGALERLRTFIGEALGDYEDQRDHPDADFTSRLSPYLHFGQIGPREIVASLSEAGCLDLPGADKFLAEVGWREFSYHLMYHFPDTPVAPLRSEFEEFPWRENEELLHAWQKGRTGYPLVDAGMRQLWQTGWMHNRVRMVAASLLVKHLLQPWQAGARWFWDTLVDADLASNTQGWQWTAGCGADAAPYFRVFNPAAQGERYDADGEYVRQWVPELADMPAKYIHRPWDAPAEVLRASGVTLGEDYPEPIVSHIEGRGRALAAFEKFKKSR